MQKLLMAALIGLSATPALAIDCSDLKPLPPKDSTTSFVGKMDASVDGFFAKLAAVTPKSRALIRMFQRTCSRNFLTLTSYTVGKSVISRMPINLRS
jgi:hypothetical protein